MNTEEGQLNSGITDLNVNNTCDKWESLTFEEVRRLHDKFVEERFWSQFHTPRNVLLALVGEVGEICELFQWKSNVEIGLKDWSEKEKLEVAEEIAGKTNYIDINKFYSLITNDYFEFTDATIYLIRLAHLCSIDISKAIKSKMGKNCMKYPVEFVKGNPAKYTSYQNIENKDHSNSL
ncbi:hypothetical protein ACR3K2_32120 [Cryptosporidium serpentis]